MTKAPARKPDVSAYAWLVFALTFGLLISDYMARQVLSAVFPLLKAEWHLTDAQLGLLSGIVAVTVGVLTCPISLLADRIGRVRSIAAMALLWSIATLLCGLAATYNQMLAARVLVGVGEAAYGSVGIAVIISVFPERLRSTLTGAFMAGGLVGQVLGVAVGGALAATHGWRIAFAAIGATGLLLAIIYPLVVRETRSARRGGSAARTGQIHEYRSLVLRPCAEVRLCRKRTPAVRRRCLARVAADLLRPLLRPAAEAGDFARRLVPSTRGSGDDCVRGNQR